MIVGDSAHCVEVVQVVLVGVVISVPSHHVKGRVVLIVVECVSLEAGEDVPLRLIVFISGYRCQEVSFVGETI